ncbi:hypothetical protein B0H19DRAFT_1275456 [Mycena capillaripes]|nr:hypothetical protein B0H19DRAFT_1275456 [Mycena capillaripes]
MAPSVLIIGASGTVGRPLVQEFLKNKTSFGRITVLADPTKVSRFADVQSHLLQRCFDTVISLAGNVALKLQPGMIDAAIAGGVRHFYPSELGTDLSYGAIGKRRYFRDKIATREHLRDRAREVPGFAYTLLMTGAFMEFGPSPFNNVDVEKHTASPYGVPDALISVTAMPDIMRYLVESILIPLEHGQLCRELRVAGETLTWAALMEALGEVQGVKYNVTYIDPREAAEKEEAARVAGDTEAEMLWAGKTVFATGAAHFAGPLDNAQFSFTPENAKETLQRLFGKK